MLAPGLTILLTTVLTAPIPGPVIPDNDDSETKVQYQDPILVQLTEADTRFVNVQILACELSSSCSKAKGCTFSCYAACMLCWVARHTRTPPD
jgi:hypothetical protein